MKAWEILTQLNTGSVVSILVIVLSLVEITPIKLSPLKWIGKRINSEAIERLDKVEKKLDEHIAQSYRNKILNAQNTLLNGQTFTMEEFDEIIEACSNYETYCEDNEIKNEKCKLAISYLKHCYKLCQDNRSFANLPQVSEQ